MKQNDYVELLRDSLARLERVERWLRRSYNVCREVNIRGKLSDEEYDAFETLTSRFARTNDIILQKVFRNIDRLELEESGTLLDVLNRAEKRRLISSVQSFREMRELRNEVAHEYSLDGLEDLFESVAARTPELLEIAADLRMYCTRYL